MTDRQEEDGEGTYRVSQFYHFNHCYDNAFLIKEKYGSCYHLSRAVDKVVILDGVFPHLPHIAVGEDTRVVVSRNDCLNEIPAVLKHRHHLTCL